jgi:all-trans-8'-apo-beta-carotenal 15,15'-oxygenase
VGFDVARQQTFGTVFDALNLAAGPIAIARLPYWAPTCFHGNFTAA